MRTLAARTARHLVRALPVAAAMTLTASCSGGPVPDLPEATYTEPIPSLQRIYEDVQLERSDGDLCPTYDYDGEVALLAFHPATEVQSFPLRVKLTDGQTFGDGGSFAGSIAPRISGGMDCGGEHYDVARVVAWPDETV